MELSRNFGDVGPILAVVMVHEGAPVRAAVAGTNAFKSAEVAVDLVISVMTDVLKFTAATVNRMSVLSYEPVAVA